LLASSILIIIFKSNSVNIVFLQKL